MKRSGLGEQELQLLRYIADAEEATVGDVAEGYGAPRGLARSTVLTVMERLRKKGYLARAQHHGVFRYRATGTNADVLRNLVASFVERSLSGSLSPFTAYLAEADDVSEEEIDQLQAALAKLQAQRGQAPG